MAVSESRILQEGAVEYIESYPEFELIGMDGRTIKIRQVEFPFLTELNAKRDLSEQRPTTFLTPTSTEINHLAFVAAKQLVDSGLEAIRVIPVMRGAAPVLRPAIDAIDGLRNASGRSLPRCVPYPMQTEFYGASIVSGDEPNILRVPEHPNDDKEEIVIEDLADRGKTLNAVILNRLSVGVEKLGVLVPFIKSTAALIEDPRVQIFAGARIGRQWISHDTDIRETMEAVEANVYRHLGVSEDLFDDMHRAMYQRRPFPGQEEALVLFERDHFIAARNTLPAGQ